MNYITVEGLEGAGKSTAMNFLREIFTEKGHSVDLVREPGGTPMAEDLRDILKSVKLKEKISSKTEAMLFYAAREQLYTNFVIPSIEKGNLVISDSGYPRSHAYQGTSDEMRKFLKVLDDNIVHNQLKTDLILFMDVEPEIGLERARGRGALDRIENKSIEYFDQCRKNYLDYFKSTKTPVIIINANREQHLVQKEIKFKISEHLKKKPSPSIINLKNS
jgi:dTMP kinase